MTQETLQIITSYFGAAGFGVIFNIHGRKLFWIGMGGALSWLVYLLFLNISGSVFIALMTATCAVVASSEVLARATKSPMIMLMVPMLIPMVPGGGLYYTMSYLIKDDPRFTESLRSLLVQAGAIAAGIIVMTSVMTNFFTLYYRAKEKNNAK